MAAQNNIGKEILYCLNEFHKNMRGPSGNNHGTNTSKERR